MSRLSQPVETTLKNRSRRLRNVVGPTSSIEVRAVMSAADRPTISSTRPGSSTSRPSTPVKASWSAARRNVTWPPLAGSQGQSTEAAQLHHRARHRCLGVAHVQLDHLVARTRSTIDDLDCRRHLSAWLDGVPVHGQLAEREGRV